MDSLFSFPLWLFHPLQHAGLSQCTPDSRRFGLWLCLIVSRSWRSRLEQSGNVLWHKCQMGKGFPFGAWLGLRNVQSMTALFS